MTMLSACAPSGKISPARSLPGECEFLSRPVELPAVGRGKDLGVIAAENRAAAALANKRIASNLACAIKERQLYQDAK